MPGAVGGDQARRRRRRGSTRTAPTPWSTSWRAAVAAVAGSASKVSSSPPTNEASSSPLGFIRSGAASGQRRDEGRERALAGVDGHPGRRAAQRRARARRTSRRAHPAAASRRARPRRRRGGPARAAVAPRSSRWDAETVAPGLLSLVVVPSGSVMARLMRTSPAGGAGQHAMPRRDELGDERVVGARGEDGLGAEAGRHRGAGDVHALAAGLHGDRQQPLDGAALERAGQRDGAVVAGVRGQRDDHRDPVADCSYGDHLDAGSLDGPAITGGDLLVGDEGVDLGQLGELDRALHADLARSRRARRRVAPVR